MPPKPRAHLPTWVQKSLAGIPAAMSVELVLMVETDPRRVAVWWRVTDVPGDRVVGMGQSPWTTWATPTDLGTEAMHWAVEASAEHLEPF